MSGIKLKMDFTNSIIGLKGSSDTDTEMKFWKAVFFRPKLDFDWLQNGVCIVEPSDGPNLTADEPADNGQNGPLFVNDRIKKLF